jgi:hypothetical protein
MRRWRRGRPHRLEDFRAEQGRWPPFLEFSFAATSLYRATNSRGSASVATNSDRPSSRSTVTAMRYPTVYHGPR